MKHFVYILFFLLFTLSLAATITAQDRFATCDLCGYCNGKTKPSAWEQCRACLYPISGSGEYTLKIDPATNLPPTPQPGHYYTMIGCIRTNLNDFTREGAAGGFVQTILTLIFTAGGGIAFLYLLYGSFLILASQADPERLNHGKRVIYGALIGIIFTVSSVFIITLIGSNVLRIPGFE